MKEYAGKLDVTAVRLGEKGIAKQIFLGTREADAGIDYIRAFVDLARTRRTVKER